MTADAAPGGVFLPTESGAASGFNELVTFYPAYSDADKSLNVNVIVVRDDEEGTREVRGDGVVLNQREGKGVRRSIKIECAASVAVREKQDEKRPDIFKVGTEFWAVKRILGRDDDMQTVLCVHREHSSIRNENRVG